MYDGMLYIGGIAGVWSSSCLREEDFFDLAAPSRERDRKEEEHVSKSIEGYEFRAA